MRRMINGVIAAGLGLIAVSACTSGSGSSRAVTGSAVSSPTTHAGAPTSPVTHGSTIGGATPTAGASIPISAADLISFVRGGRTVSAGEYRFGASGSGQPMRPTPGIDEFTTPSGNIDCGILAADAAAHMDAQTSCSVKQYTYSAPPRPANCSLNYAPGWLTLDAAGVTQALCLGGPPFPETSHTLAYGSTITEGPMSCRSDASFLACADTATGHGFVVNRTTLKTY